MSIKRIEKPKDSTTPRPLLLATACSTYALLIRGKPFHPRLSPMLRKSLSPKNHVPAVVVTADERKANARIDRNDPRWRASISVPELVTGHSVCSNDMAEAIFEAGADDADVSSRGGFVLIHFDRQIGNLISLSIDSFRFTFRVRSVGRFTGGGRV